jgi:hypothetical protein
VEAIGSKMSVPPAPTVKLEPMGKALLVDISTQLKTGLAVAEANVGR